MDAEERLGAFVSIKFAVLGASSFSGGAFCRFLRANRIECVELSRPFCDVNTIGGRANIYGLLKQHRPTYLVNFAALNVVADSWIHFADYYQTNVVGMSKVADMVSEIDSIERWVQVSTPEVYGATQTFLKEDAPYNPSTPYAVSRAAFDMHLLALNKAKGFPVCFTRSVNVYGPHQQLYRIIPKTVLKVKRGEKLILDGGGVSTRSFIHIDDVSNSVYKVALLGKDGQIYHTSTNDQISIRTLVGLIVESLGKNFDECVTVGPERPGKDLAYQLDSSKIREQLGWSDQIPLGIGLKETVHWVNVKANEGAFDGKSLEYEHRA